VTRSRRVFIVDDDASVREALTTLLRSAGYAVESFESPEAFLGSPRPAVPSCLILDLRMPRVDGLQLQACLSELGFGLPIIFLSGEAQVLEGVRAMKAGAVDFLTKPVDDELLIETIEAALAAHRQALGEAAEGLALRRLVDSLTPREYETARCVVAGLLNKQIADRMGISEATVKVHRGRVMQKLGVTSVADLVRLLDAAGVSSLSTEAP
jgi:FixJ family two-component response regulator